MARAWQVRVDGHVGAPGLENSQQGDDHFRAAPQAHGHSLVRFDAQPDQTMGQSIGLAVELFIAEQRPGVAAYGTGERALFGLLFEQLVDQHIPRIVAGRGVEFDLHTLALGLAHQWVMPHRRFMLLQHRLEHRDDALLQVSGFFQAEVSGVEVEIKVDVFEWMVIAHEDRHGRLLITVVHGDDRGRGAAELIVAVQAFERQGHVEQLATPGLGQAQGAIEFGDGEALVTVAAAQLPASGVHQIQQRGVEIDGQADRADRGKHAGGFFRPGRGAVVHGHADDDFIDTHGATEIGGDHADQHMGNREAAFAGKLRQRVVQRPGQHRLDLGTGRQFIGLPGLEIGPALQQRRRHLCVGVLPELAVALIAGRGQVSPVIFQERQVGMPLGDFIVAGQQRVVGRAHGMADQGHANAVGDQVVVAGEPIMAVRAATDHACVPEPARQ
ncbi:hypothetical protein ASC85_24475 [Pseudomonas sp. Root401]|nr:hypothetical protein ASC85_24475 [Pseudomonas sp. Root401]